MQVSATLIAAQQAAREARTRLAMPQAPAAATFTAALEKTSGVQPGFSALPLRQTAAPSQPAASAPAGAPARMGQHIDITV
jgi:hypothetical protein